MGHERSPTQLNCLLASGTQNKAQPSQSPCHESRHEQSSFFKALKGFPWIYNTDMVYMVLDFELLTDSDNNVQKRFLSF